MSYHKLVTARKVEIKEYYCRGCVDWHKEITIIVCKECGKKMCPKDRLVRYVANIDQYKGYYCDVCYDNNISFLVTL